eukprot:1888180-Amphidinium_carterae.3
MIESLTEDRIRSQEVKDSSSRHGTRTQPGRSVEVGTVSPGWRGPAKMVDVSSLDQDGVAHVRWQGRSSGYTAMFANLDNINKLSKEHSYSNNTQRSTKQCRSSLVPRTWDQVKHIPDWSGNQEGRTTWTNASSGLKWTHATLADGEPRISERSGSEFQGHIQSKGTSGRSLHVLLLDALVILRIDNEEDEIVVPSQLDHPVEPTPSYDEERKDQPNDGDGRRQKWEAQAIDARSRSRDDSQSDSSNGER